LGAGFLLKTKNEPAILAKVKNKGMRLLWIYSFSLAGIFPFFPHPAFIFLTFNRSGEES
jgi:hypothetical protein